MQATLTPKKRPDGGSVIGERYASRRQQKAMMSFAFVGSEPLSEVGSGGLDVAAGDSGSSSETTGGDGGAAGLMWASERRRLLSRARRPGCRQPTSVRPAAWA